MSEQDILSPRPGFTVMNAPVDPRTANGPFQTYFTTGQKADFDDACGRLIRSQRDRIIVLRDGFQKADGTTAKAGDVVGVVDAGGMAAAVGLAHLGWLNIIEGELVVRRQAAADAEWVADPAGPAMTLSGQIIEPGGEVSQATCAFIGDARTVYDAKGNSVEAPLGPRSHDGEAKLEELIEAGRVVPGPGHKGNSRKTSEKATAS